MESSQFETSSLKFEFGRRATFELAVVPLGSTPGETGIDTQKSGRAHPRAGVGTVLGTSFYPGDRILQIAGGDADTPTIFARSPYIF